MSSFVLAVVLGLGPQIGLEGESRLDAAKRGLSNGCHPVVTLIDAPEQSQELVDQVKDTVELRLRSAGLFGGFEIPAGYNVNGLLYLTVQTVGAAFIVNTDFQRVVIVTNDPTATPLFARTWDDGIFGTGDKNFVVDNVGKLVDRFTLDYLRANETACKERASR